MLVVEALPNPVDPRPFRVLVDKDDATGHLHAEPKEPRPAPTAEEFLECVHWFYAEALQTAKCIVRDELFMAKSRDAELKSMLLRMLEWDHRPRYGAGYDTWYLGTHWREWMDPDIQAALHECWASANAHSSAAALRNTIRLFARVSERAGATLGQPPFHHGKVAKELERRLVLMRGRGPAGARRRG